MAGISSFPKEYRIVQEWQAGQGLSGLVHSESQAAALHHKA